MMRRELSRAKSIVDIATLAVRDRPLAQAVLQVRRERLTYLSTKALVDLGKAARAVEDQDIPGRIIEAGTALGGSAIVLATAKHPHRQMALYDTFGLIPPPSDADGEDVHQRYEEITAGKSTGLGGEVYYGYRNDLPGEVTASFERHRVPVQKNSVELVQGTFQDTLHVEGPVALAHLDGDWYESTMVCLERIVPHLSPAGRLVIDDYDAWSGCRKAVDEFFADRPGFTMERHARLHVVKH